MEERRESPRKEAGYRVEYEPVDDPLARGTAKCSDISMGGMGLQMHKLMTGCNRLKVRIHRALIGKPIEAEARMVWQRENTVTGQRTAGIQFMRMGLSELKSLLE